MCSATRDVRFVPRADIVRDLCSRFITQGFDQKLIGQEEMAAR
jgi:hypothetical protein